MRYNPIKANSQNMIIKHSKRNSANTFEVRNVGRQWPRFPALKEGFVPDDDILFSIIFFWFFFKGYMKSDSEPPSPNWQTTKTNL